MRASSRRVPTGAAPARRASDSSLRTRGQQSEAVQARHHDVAQDQIGTLAPAPRPGRSRRRPLFPRCSTGPAGRARSRACRRCRRRARPGNRKSRRSVDRVPASARRSGWSPPSSRSQRNSAASSRPHRRRSWHRWRSRSGRAPAASGARADGLRRTEPPPGRSCPPRARSMPRSLHLAGSRVPVPMPGRSRNPHASGHAWLPRDRSVRTGAEVPVRAPRRRCRSLRGPRADRSCASAR